MSDQGTAKKRPLEEDSRDETSSSPHGNRSGTSASSGQNSGDGPSSKKPRPEESSSSSPAP
ncbi:hypothetical protein BGZ95_010759, partial [Linnemannia exigua]